jgi:methylated-DNA-[protein]-cysteine S-methyltransferase
VLAFDLVSTPIGPLGLVWSAGGLAGVQLPERDAGATRATLQRRFPAARAAERPAWLEMLVDAIGDHLAGGRPDYTAVALDFGEAPAFDRRVYDALLRVPIGETTTYGGLAGQIGDPGAARAVGAALGRNPIPLVVPCHRVVAAGRRSGGVSAPGGRGTKLKLLMIERALPAGTADLFGPRGPTQPGTSSGGSAIPVSR